MENTSHTSDIPSRHAGVLGSFIGHRIIAATRFSWWSPEEAKEECGVREQDVFSLTAGPVAISFDSGAILGIASEPSVNSVVVWMERDEAGHSMREEPLSSDTDLYPILATDPTFADDFWHGVIGAKVEAITTLVRKSRSPRLADLPSEVGLCFLLDSGVKVVAAHGLHDDSDDFVIIPDHLILAAIRADLHEAPIGAAR
jgi:hypothetical protein